MMPIFSATIKIVPEKPSSALTGKVPLEGLAATDDPRRCGKHPGRFD